MSAPPDPALAAELALRFEALVALRTEDDKRRREGKPALSLDLRTMLVSAIGHESPRTRRCSSCGAPIIWLETHKGGAMPNDAHTVLEGQSLYDPAVNISHFATCPHARHHRRA